ncbi:MAG: hypothetical protein ACNA7O_04130 [Rhodobacterales bacterium]
MKLFPVLAIAVVGGFASLGFAAGTLVTTQDNVTANTGVADTAALPQQETQADAILRAAAAKSDEAAPDVSSPAPTHQTAGQTPADKVSGPHLVRMANVTFPVRKPQSVSFVVADLAVSVRDATSAAHYDVPQNAARLQAAIEQAMASAADTPIMRGVTIDSRELSGKLTAQLKQSFTDVEDVLFLTLYKHDVAYN